MPEAGTYILITETSKGAALSIPKDTALQMKDDALEYYKKAGSYKGLIMQEEGTGTYCYDDYSYNFLTEDGYFYIPECGRVCASFGNIFTFGIKDGSRLWRVFYRLSPEEAASLPEPTHEA